MKRILVGTGGSRWSEAAVAYAARLAKEQGAELLIVHVLSPPALPAHEKRHREAEAILERARKVAAEHLETVDARCLKGTVADVLIDTADREDCDLIVIGSRGRSRVRDRLLGSVLLRVIADTHRPVTVVKESAELEEALKVGKERMAFPETPEPYAHLEAAAPEGAKREE
ncbi:MAG: universal stress protein [Nitrospinota bacterium]